MQELNQILVADNSSDCHTVVSDIPEEDSVIFANEQNVRMLNYNRFEDHNLFMKFIQWEQSSHGLFDFEMMHTRNKYFWTNKSKVVLRQGFNIQCVDEEKYKKEDFGNDYQEIFRIKKEGKRYFIEGVKPTDPTKDIDECYLESGEPMLPANQMEERMFSVIKYMVVGTTNRSRDHKIQTNDVIKMGRIKFKVKKVHIKEEIELKMKQKLRRKDRLKEEKKQFRLEVKKFKKK